MKKIIQRSFHILRSTEGKTITKNFISLSVLKIVGYVFPLITLPYLSRVIGVDKFGELAFAAAIIIYFQTIVDFGFNYTATRDIAQNRGDMTQVSTIFSTVMSARVLLLIASALLMAILIYTIPYFNERSSLLWLTFLLVPGYVIFPEWFFQAMEDMKYITIMNILSRLLFTILVFFVIKEKDDYIYQPLLIAMGSTISGITSLWIIIAKYKIKFHIPRIKELILIFKGGYSMFVTQIFPNLYTSVPTAYLNIIGGNVASGLFSEGSKLSNIATQVTGILSRVFFPFLARRIDKHNLYAKLCLTIGMCMSIATFFFAELFIKLFYTEDFSDAVNVIKIRALTPFLLILFNTYGVNYLILIKKDRLLRNIVISCSVAGMFMSLLLVNYFGYIGLSISITIVLGSLGLTTYLYSRKMKNENENENRN